MIISDIFGLKYRKGAFVGIEIETEAPREYAIPAMSNWTHVVDGSLRNFGIEYVTHPIIDNEIDSALLNFSNSVVNNRNFRIANWCPRAGVHVHVNVSDMTPTQVWTFVCAYWLLENSLVDWCGPSRVHNPFAKRVSVATRIITSACNDVQSSFDKGDTPFLNTFTNEGYKYSSCNIVPVVNKGTVEFRSLDGTTDIVRIRKWINQLLHLRETSLSFSNPRDLVEWVEDNDESRLVHKDFEKQNIKCSNLGLVSAVAFSVDNWEMKKKPKAKKVPVNGVPNIIRQANNINFRVEVFDEVE
jgi:Putative amidoligase enzyme